MSTPLRAIGTTILTLAVTAALVVYAFWNVDLAALGALLAGGDYRTLIPFEVLLFVYYWFTAIRWRGILTPLGRYSVAQVTPSMMIGFGGNNLLPAHLGEIVRAIVFARQFRCSRSAVLATLFLERLLDVFAILLLYALSAVRAPALPESLREGFVISAAVVGVAAIGILLFLRYPSAFVRLWERLSRPLPPALAALGSRVLRGVEAGLAALRSPFAVGGMLVYSLLKWLCAAGMVWLALWGYGVQADPALAMVVVAVSAVAVTLPTVPGFFGVMQAAFVFALVPFGISREAALASSVFFLLAQWVPVTAVGVAYFVSSGLGLRRMREEMARAE